MTPTSIALAIYVQYGVPNPRTMAFMVNTLLALRSYKGRA